MTDVGEIVNQFLMDNEFDGLFNYDRECYCFAGELSPADCLSMDCEPAYKVFEPTANKDAEWIGMGRLRRKPPS